MIDISDFSMKLTCFHPIGLILSTNLIIIIEFGDSEK